MKTLKEFWQMFSFAGITAAGNFVIITREPAEEHELRVEEVEYDQPPDELDENFYEEDLFYEQSEEELN